MLVLAALLGVWGSREMGVGRGGSETKDPGVPEPSGSPEAEFPDESVSEVFFQARAARHRRDFEAAVAGYTKVIASAPRHPAAYWERGLAYGHLGRSREAVEDYTRLLELQPLTAMAYTNRGWERFRLGDYQGTLEDSDRAIELSPRDGCAYDNRGCAYAALGERQKALEDLKRACELVSDPRHREHLATVQAGHVPSPDSK